VVNKISSSVPTSDISDVTFRTNLVDIYSKGTAGTGETSGQVQANNYLSTGCIKNNAAGPLDVGNNY
jgi:hypothetical protein